MRLSKHHRYPFTLLSDRECEVDGCQRRIKLRLVVQKDAKVCYQHWIAAETLRRGGGDR